MGATVRFLVISAAIIIPWAVIRIADWEMKIIALLKRVVVSGAAILALLFLPPLALVLARWLFQPRRRSSKKYSADKGLLIRFRG